MANNSLQQWKRALQQQDSLSSNDWIGEQTRSYDVMDPLTRKLLERHIAELERGADVASLETLVNPWRE